MKSWYYFCFLNYERRVNFVSYFFISWYCCSKNSFPLNRKKREGVYVWDTDTAIRWYPWIPVPAHLCLFKINNRRYVVFDINYIIPVILLPGDIFFQKNKVLFYQGKNVFFSEKKWFLSKTKCLLNCPISKMVVFGFAQQIQSPHGTLLKCWSNDLIKYFIW